MKKSLTLISSFFESPYHKNRAPYNEQLFLELKHHFDIKIIRPIAWTDIRNSRVKVSKKEYYSGKWNDIPIWYPTYYFLPRIALSTNGMAYYKSIQKSVKNIGAIPDIFYTTWAYPDAYATMLLAKKFNRRYILRVHGSDINDLAFRASIAEKVNSVLQNAAAVISPSIALKKKMLKLGIAEDKIHVIYSGIDKLKFFFRDRKNCEEKLNLSKERKRILYIGNFKVAKGVFDLLEAGNRLREEFEKFEILFIGKGEVIEKMRGFISEHQLENHVRIIGTIDHHKLNPWINSSDCVCLPSYAEGLPNVLLEALACKTNVIASNVGGIPEIIKNPSEYLVDSGDIDGLKKKLYGILSGRTKPTEAAISIKTYKDISDQITGIINRILNN